MRSRTKISVTQKGIDELVKKSWEEIRDEMNRKKNIPSTTLSRKDEVITKSASFEVKKQRKSLLLNDRESSSNFFLSALHEKISQQRDSVKSLSFVVKPSVNKKGSKCTNMPTLKQLLNLKERKRNQILQNIIQIDPDRIYKDEFDRPGRLKKLGLLQSDSEIKQRKENFIREKHELYDRNFQLLQKLRSRKVEKNMKNKSHFIIDSRKSKEDLDTWKNTSKRIEEIEKIGILMKKRHFMMMQFKYAPYRKRFNNKRLNTFEGFSNPRIPCFKTEGNSENSKLN